MTDGIFVFSNSQLTTNSSGVFNTSGTGQAIKGWIEKITITSQLWGNGSLFLIDKTTGEVILNQNNASGTAITVVYPRTIVSTSISGASLSGTGNGGYEKIYVNGPIQISGVGLGNTTSGTVTLFYSSYD